jgi:hypothetical protein
MSAKSKTRAFIKRQPIATIDDLHKRLVAAEIGVTSPMMIIRDKEKIFLIVTPRELER